MNKEAWHIFFWAALHHPMFKYCTIISPITVQWHCFKTFAGWQCSIKVHIEPLRVNFPYEVINAYYTAHDQPITFDDIPF